MFISSPEYADAINELIDAYKEVAPDVTINYETTQNDYPTLLKAKLNSGEIPDIFSSTSGKEIDVYREWSADLSDQPLAETMLPSVASSMASTEEGGGIYGLAIKGNYFGLVYNKAIFDEVGIEVPKTLDEVEAGCQLFLKLVIHLLPQASVSGGYSNTSGLSPGSALTNADTTVAELVQKFENGEAKDI